MDPKFVEFLRRGNLLEQDFRTLPATDKAHLYSDFLKRENKGNYVLYLLGFSAFHPKRYPGKIRAFSASFCESMRTVVTGTRYFIKI